MSEKSVVEKLNESGKGLVIWNKLQRSFKELKAAVASAVKEVYPELRGHRISGNWVAEYFGYWLSVEGEDVVQHHSEIKGSVKTLEKRIEDKVKGVFGDWGVDVVWRSEGTAPNGKKLEPYLHVQFDPDVEATKGMPRSASLWDD